MKLKLGDSINSYKRVITNYELPFLLNKGKIIEIVNNETIEHLYVQDILIGYAEISKDNIQSKSTENNINNTSYCKTKCPNNCYDNVCIRYLRPFEKKRIVFGRRGTRA